MKITNEQNLVIAGANLLRASQKGETGMSVAEYIRKSATILNYKIKSDELVMMVSYFKKVFEK